MNLLHPGAAFAQHHHHDAADGGVQEQQPAPTPPDATDPQGLDQAARLLFESARTAFAAGDYTTALERFQQAYSASPRPLLLYNIATTLDRLRRDDEAVSTFQQFLTAVPDSPNRAEIEGRLRVLQQAIDERHAQEAAAQAQQEATQQAAAAAAARAAEEQRRLQELAQHHDETPPPPPHSGLPPAVFIATAITAGVSLALVIPFGILTGNANSDQASYAAMPGASVTMANDKLQNAYAMQTLTNAFLFGGAGVAVLALVFAFLTDWGGGHADTPPAGSTAPTVSFDEHHVTLGAITRF